MSLSLSRARKALLVTTSAGLLAGLAAMGPGASAEPPETTVQPHWYGVRTDNPADYRTNGVPGEAKGGKPGGGGGGGSNGIDYHGGPLILGTTHAYFIWYGDWTGATAPTSNSTAQTILTHLASNIGGSSYYNINTTYYNGSNTHVSNSVSLAGATFDHYTQGSGPLSDSQIGAIVATAISSGALPTDTSGVYFVLTSGDVKKQGFLTQYCGWHTQGTISGSDIKYSFVGDPAARPWACEAQSTSPNGNPSADGMASVIAHELEEAVTDPDLNAWYDSQGYENADKCAWTFGVTTTLSTGAKYNVTLNGTRYLIQQNWVNYGGGYCSLSY